MAMYSGKWKVKCPKCDYQITNDNYDCKNCGKGQLRTRKTYSEGSGWSVTLGCNKCAHGGYAGTAECPNCGAVANLGNQFSVLARVIVFVVLVLIFLFIAYGFFMSG